MCRDMVADFYAAQLLLKKHPGRFRVVRYEDLSLSPQEITKELLDFYGLPMDPEVEEFLESHTKLDIGGVSSTYRDSKSAPFHWIKDLAFEEVIFKKKLFFVVGHQLNFHLQIDTIQNGCTKAMELWGYKKATNLTILSNKFDPILPYSLTWIAIIEVWKIFKQMKYSSNVCQSRGENASHFTALLFFKKLVCNVFRDVLCIFHCAIHVIIESDGVWVKMSQANQLKKIVNLSKFLLTKFLLWNWVFGKGLLNVLFLHILLW